MAEVDRIKGAAKKADCLQGRLEPILVGSHPLTWPSPSTTYFCEVSPSSPTGPRAWILSVEMPISAPRPYSKPSAKRVDALTITELESTSRRNLRVLV